MESADSGDCNTSLDLGLGFRQELGSRLERKKLKTSIFPFLALGFSESNHRLKEDEDTGLVGGRKRSVAAAASSSFTGVSSMYSHASKVSDEEEDEDYSTPRKKLRLSKDQILALEDIFKGHSTLNPKQKQELATQLNLLPRQVEVWFQNRRARVKVKQTEIDREELRKICESLKEENRRLKKELVHLKSSKPTVPFLMHIGSPVPSLSICPSCGGTGSSNSSNGSAGTSFFSNNTRKIRKTSLCKSIQ